MTAAAHPPVLRPVIERLEAGGHEVAVTAREYGQTLGILERLGIPYVAIGRHADAGTVAKGAAVARRSAALWRWARGRRFDLALAHGSVDLAVVATALRIPSVQMQDYEHAGLQRQLSWRAARRVIVPDVIPVERLRKAGAAPYKLVRYPGLKEDYYLSDFVPDPSALDQLGVDRDRVIAVVRPPPETSAYHAENPLYAGVLDRLAEVPVAVAVIIPRTEAQASAARDRNDPTLIVPEHAVDAQSLIALGDLVVGAGGTMNREAVALGTPVFTTFEGRLGAVDERLMAEGRLLKLSRADEVVVEKHARKVQDRVRRDPRDFARLMLAGLH
ncbi:MAG: DUF354 domain-containing protein [Solirubrobacterales bacterium]